MKNKKTFLSKIAVLIFLLFGMFSFGKANAVEYGMIGGKPANPDEKVENSESWFIYNLNPEEKKDDAVTVMNLFDAPNDVLVYAADTTPSSSGGFALKQFSEPKDEVGSWVKFYPNDVPEFFKNIFETKAESSISKFCQLNRDDLQDNLDEKITLNDENFNDFQNWCRGEEYLKLNLAAQEKRNINFVISIPKTAEVGDHTGGILIQKVAAEDMKVSSGSAVKLTTRVGVRIYETVPGEVVRKLTLESFNVIKNFKELSFGDWFGKEKKKQEYLIQSTVKNDGNVSVQQENTIHIKDLLFGRKNEDVSREFQVMKKDEFISNYSWNNPRFGRFSFTIEAKYKDASGADAVLQSKEIKLWIIPWREMLIAAVILLFFFLVFLFYRMYQKRKYGGIGWNSYRVAEGDNINSLAAKFEIDWRILAKTNKIDAPYFLQAGQIIMVPSNGENVAENIVEKNKFENKITVENKISEPIFLDEILSASPNETANIKQRRGRKPKSLAVDKHEIVEKLFSENIEKPVVGVAEKVEEKPKETDYKKIAIILAVFASISFIAAIVLAVMFFKKPNKCSEFVNGKISIEDVGKNSSESQTAVNSPVTNKAEENIKQTDSESDSENKTELVKSEEINVKILNGGAVPGSAGKLKNVLIKNNYAKVEAQNAAEEDHEGAIIYYAENFEKEATAMKDLLKTKYSEISSQQASTDEEKSSDVVIILGK